MEQKKKEKKTYMKKTRLITITLLFIISIVFIGCGYKNNLEKVLTSDGGTWLFNEADKSYNIKHEEADLKVSFYENNSANGYYKNNDGEENTIELFYKIIDGSIEIYPKFNEKNIDISDKKTTIKNITIKDKNLIEAQIYENNRFETNIVLKKILK